MKAQGPKQAPDRALSRVAAAVKIACAALFAATATPASAAEGDAQSRKADAIERALEQQRERSAALERKAKSLNQETAALSRELVALAREARTLEQKIARHKVRLDDIRNLEHEKLGALRSERDKLAKLLGALQRIARNPPEAMMAYGGSARDVLRGAMLLRAVLPKLEAQATALKTELDSITRLRADAAKRKAALDDAAAKLSVKRRGLDALLKRKRALTQTTLEERKRALARSSALASRANNLHGLLASIEHDRKRLRVPAPPEAKAENPSAPIPPRPPASTRMSGQTQLALAPVLRMSRARGRLTAPVVGRVVARFGRKEPIGTRIKGLRFETDGGAQVVAPHAGQVVFAGEFRGYGRLLIIDHGEGYHTLLAGLGRIDVAVDQKLLTGEPVGIMAPSGRGSPRLYLELRRNGRPVDPQPWLAATPNDKVSG